MILALHILIALTSVGYTTYLFVSPTTGRLHAACGLVAATLVSGLYLVVTTPTTHLAQICTTGLIYVGAVTFGLVAACRKLAHAPAANQ